MKKINYLFALLIFTLFIPKVYAFTYEVEMVTSQLKVNAGTEVEVKVVLKDIQGTNEGIKSCSLNIDLDNNILLNSEVKPLGDWNLTIEKKYFLNISENIKSQSELLVIPIKVNGNGAVKLSELECTDGNTVSKLDNNFVNFTVIDSSNNNVVDDENSSCNLSNIVLSEGNIEFDPNVTNYYVEVSNFDNLKVEPVLVDNKSVYEVMKTDNNEIIINITSDGDCNKKYTIFVEQLDNTVVDNEDGSNNKYVPIFIAIIVLLLLINVYRIVKNKKKNVTD